MIVKGERAHTAILLSNSSVADATAYLKGLSCLSDTAIPCNGYGNGILSRGPTGRVYSGVSCMMSLYRISGDVVSL